ncbi:2TM domain-containing protein [Cryobacterium sp. 1639]|uniref:2TM domain-containing protein n=1 Tax=Cryobacterium inferilacus TaxID=2866629 RepID=UPI001C72F212|nr:2TM domain-containing protein [Cryobacterium sp. 1639]MBX0298710.1 2TM domain-containing protein [Cryobacterium sp. 1639]
MNNDELRTLARKRLKARRDFWNYCGVWLGVSLIVTAVWLLTDPGGYFWPIWPIGGMGIAAFFIGLDAFGPNRGIITEEAIDEEVAKITRSAPRSDTK